MLYYGCHYFSLLLSSSSLRFADIIIDADILILLLLILILLTLLRYCLPLFRLLFFCRFRLLMLHGFDCYIRRHCRFAFKMLSLSPAADFAMLPPMLSDIIDISICDAIVDIDAAIILMLMPLVTTFADVMIR